ncbi:MAG TPA: GNAT family N-acetyltransferase [Candidatus Dormibacteraeota bacterium]|nr:GNAT family N-acetyltransferase [Candidatus Dormibacteraeota bacterium]
MRSDRRRRAPAELETDRLRLRPWRAGDLPAFTRIRRDADVARYLGDGEPPSEAACECYLEDRMRRWLEHGVDAWAVELKETGQLAGWVGLTVPERRPGSCLEIGWVLGRGHWGRGLATEAARECLRCGFDDLHEPAIGARHHIDNVASARVMGRLGMTVTGDEVDRGRRYRVCGHQITSEQWRRSPGGQDHPRPCPRRGAG